MCFKGNALKIKLSFAVATLLVSPVSVLAETEMEELPTIIVEGASERPGAFFAAPDSSGLKDTASLLKSVPGANVNRSGPLTGIAQYRGMAGNRINIAIDGVNMKEVGPNSMDPPLSHYPAALTGALTVHRGIAPVSSGIETIGGSMKVESRKGEFADEEEDFKTTGVASMGYSSVEDGHYGALMGSVANQNHKIHLSGSQESGRDYRYRHNNKVSPSKYDRNAFTAGYGYQRAGHEFGVNYSNNDTGHTGTPALPMDIVYVRGGLYDAKYNWDMGDGIKLTSGLHYQKMRHLMDNALLREPANPNMLMVNRTTVEAGGLDLALELPLFSGAIKVGFNFDQSNHEADIDGSMQMSTGLMPMIVQNFNGIERDRYSAFGEWNGQVAEKLMAEFGARVTYAETSSGTVNSAMADMCASMNADMAANNMVMDREMHEMHQNACSQETLRDDFNSQARAQDDLDVDLTAIFNYNYDDNLNLEMGFARKNRMPSYQERYLWLPLEATAGLADGRVYAGNQDIAHETAYQFELGFDWHNEKAYVAPRMFYHYVDDYIQGVPIEESNVSAEILEAATNVNAKTLRFDNVEAHLYGIDLEAGYSIDDFWRVDASLSYVKGERLDSPTDDSDLYRMAPLNGRAQVSYEAANWMSAVEGVFYANQGDVAGYNEELATKGYMLLNLRGNYEPLEGLVIATGLENVLDTEHEDHLGGYDRTNGGTTRVPMRGRNIYATLSYNW